MEALRGVLRDMVKGGLCWLLYKYHVGFVDIVSYAAVGAYRQPATQQLGGELKKHWEKSLRSVALIKLAFAIAAIGGVAFGAISFYPFENSLAKSVRYFGGLAFIAAAALPLFIALWHLFKFQVLKEMLVFALLTAKKGYVAAVGLLPDFIGKNLETLADPVLQPFIDAANKLADAIWTIFIGAGTLVLFIFVFNIQLNPQWFIAVLLGGAVLAGVVIRWPPESEWLRPVAITMVVITFGTAAAVSIYPALQTKASIRSDCIEQYYLYGAPKDPVLKTRCEANVEDNLMATLNDFAAMNFRSNGLTEDEQRKFDALKSVIEGAIKGKVVAPVIPPAPTKKAVTVAPPPAAKKEKSKPVVVVKKPSKQEEALAKLKEHQGNLDKLLTKQ